MQPEIEIKFLDLNHDMVRERLQSQGGKLVQPMRLMKRVIIDYPDFRLRKAGERLRIRDEGDKIMVNFKSHPDGQTYANETEVTIGSFETMAQLFEQIGLQQVSYQESKRETWTLDDCEVVLDEWPWLKPYIEIEGPSELEIQTAAAKLGLQWEDGVFGPVETAYRAEYPGFKPDEQINMLSAVQFNMPLPDWLTERKTAA